MIASTQHAPAQSDATAPGPALEARFVEAPEARAMAAAWRDLFHACAEANPFYGPDFLLPLLALGGKLERASFLIVSRGEELVLLCPILKRRFGWPGLRPSLATARHEFIFNSLPLIRRGLETGAWRAMLDALEARYGRGFFTLGASPLDGPVARGLMLALAESLRPSLVLHSCERAGILSAGTLEAHLSRIKARTLSKLRRHVRELGKLGKLGFRAAASGAALAEAVDAFLELEARGWKGRQGSAFASDPRGASFARQALACGGDAPGVRAELLTLDERPIGAFLHLVAPAYSATFKIAHDEDLARQAPGVLTMLHSLRGLHAEPWTQRLDSGASPEHAVGAVWRDRIPAGEVLMALSPRQGQGELIAHARAQALMLGLRAKARDAYYALTRRKRTQARKAKTE
ncbi:MAG: GNAT family N-acetyltransferase [Hyphomicrobiales bacterium]